MASGPVPTPAPYYARMSVLPMSPPSDVPPSGEDEPQKSSREEFWYFALFWLGMGITVAVSRDAIDFDVLGNILDVAYLLLFVPLITAGIRRLHDTGRGGEWWLLALMPPCLIILAVMWSKPSQPHPNEFGGYGDGELGGSLWGRK